MTKELQIINIDGTEGSGKTTQISVLANHFRKTKEVLVNYLEGDIKSALECAERTKDFLLENPNSIVINDGSIARMMVLDLNKILSQTYVIEKYRPVLFHHEQLNHSYGMANILTIMGDLECCNARLKKESELLGLTSYKVINYKIESNTIQGMRRFNNNTIINNLKFHAIEIDSEESILEVKERIIDYLKDNFKISY